MPARLEQALVCATAIALLVASGVGCGSDDFETRNGVASAQGGAAAPVLVRGCDGRVGDGRLSPTRNDLILGNARLYAASQHAPVRMGGVFASGKRLEGRWRAFKTLVILNGAEATLRVPPRDRPSFLLAYDPAQVENFAYRRSDGRGAVRFANCSPPRRNLEFAGSLIARRPGCYHLEELSEDGAVVAGGVVNIAMGRGECRAVAAD